MDRIAKLYPETQTKILVVTGIFAFCLVTLLGCYLVIKYVP
jgi:hypothetical protein